MIPELSKLTFGHRIIVTLVIVLVLLFALALFGYITGGWEAEGKVGEVALPPISKYENQLIEIDRKAISAAYHDQIKLLFQNWMKDVSDKSQPSRALVGANHAREAYNRSIEAIDKREQTLKDRK